jgi:hypothetical protein
MLRREFEALHPGQRSDLEQPESFDFDEQANTFGVTQIAIERTVCYGSCPAYVAVLEKDGRTSYWGGPHAPRQGQRSGVIHSGFAYLARLANELRLSELNDNYAAPVTDNPTVYVAITQHGRKKIIRHYAPWMSGPAKLLAFEQEIDRVLERAEWK